MCDRCDLEMALYGEKPSGFRCSDVTAKLLAEEANGIARFPNRKTGKPADKGEPGEGAARGGAEREN